MARFALCMDSSLISFFLFFFGGGGGVISFFILSKIVAWNICERVRGIFEKIPSMGGEWLFSGNTHCGDQAGTVALRIQSVIICNSRQVY